MTTVRQLFLLDAHALCYRAFFAIKNLTNKNGQPTNAVYGFVTTLRRILREYRPAFLAVCFDHPGKTHRAERFRTYKIQRPAMPDPLVSQMSWIEELVQAYRLAAYQREGYEADDLIAAFVAAPRPKGVEVVIVTEDKDLYQLVGEGVKVLSLRDGCLLGPEEVRERLGVPPGLIPDWIGLAGDSTDNIPGVEGIGRVTARKLVNRFGTIEGILEHLDEVTPARVRDAVDRGKETALFCRDLARLEKPAVFDVDWEALRVREPDAGRLFEIFTRLEFSRLRDEAASSLPHDAGGSVERIEEASAVRRMAAEGFSPEGACALLYVPAGSDVLFGEDRLLIAGPSGRVTEVPAARIPDLRPLFEDPKVLKVTYDLKEFHRVLPSGATVSPVFDVRLAGYLLAPSRAAHRLSALTGEYLGRPLREEASARVRAVVDLCPVLSRELDRRALRPLLEEIEQPLAVVLARMEREGVRVDVGVLQDLAEECRRRMDGLEKDLTEMAGERFNQNSPRQLSRILFEKLKLTPLKRTKTGFSTNEEVLTRLAAEHPLPAAVLEYRQLAKLKSTYLDALPRLIDPETGRIHARFDQTGTETGRLSSYEPNLQNIPVRTELGRRIRRAFIPFADDHRLLSADYSQIELRILAHLSGDEELKRAFERGEDVHRCTAARIFDVPEREVTPGMRDTAKRVNFGIIYGISAYGLARDLGISAGEAQGFIDRYFLRYPGVRRFMDEAVRTCEEMGYVVTLLNRRRYLPEIRSSDNALVQFARRQAINTPVQGSAADLIKRAMIDVQEALDRSGSGARLILTVHDELVLDVPENECAEVGRLVRKAMEEAIPLSVPIRVTLGIGRNWLETKEGGAS